jgi:hypothetical protein
VLLRLLPAVQQHKAATLLSPALLLDRPVLPLCWGVRQAAGILPDMPTA